MWCKHTVDTASQPTCVTIACAHDRRSVQARNSWAVTASSHDVMSTKASCGTCSRAITRAPVIVPWCALSRVFMPFLCRRCDLLRSRPQVSFNSGCCLACTQLVVTL